jgi:hypothetical protein
MAVPHEKQETAPLIKKNISRYRGGVFVVQLLRWIVRVFSLLIFFSFAMRMYINTPLRGGLKRVIAVFRDVKLLFRYRAELFA